MDLAIADRRTIICSPSHGLGASAGLTSVANALGHQVARTHHTVEQDLQLDGGSHAESV